MQRKLGVIALVCTLLCGVLTGCPQQQTIASLAGILGNAGASVAALENNAELAAKIRTDTAAAVTAIQNWKQGTPAQNVIQVINIVEDDLSLIPIDSKYTALVELALGTASSIILIIEANSGGAPIVAAHTSKRTVHLTAPPKDAAAFKKQWNAIVKANPSLSAAKL